MRLRQKRLIALAAAALFVALLVMIGCAPTPSEPEPEPAAEWTIDSDCASCHTTEVASGTDKSNLYSWHSEEPGVTCTTCHVDDDGGLTKGHANYADAQPPTKLRRSRVPSSSCEIDGCHVQSKLAQATASSTVLTDANGTVVNPHQLPDTPSHTNNINCSSCHRLHVVQADLDKDANDLCDGCHHEHVYECNTCHK